jgi:hypothetical protein
MIYTGPVRNAFDAGSIHYESKWEGVWPWKSRAFLCQVKWNRADRRVPFGAQNTPPSIQAFVRNN